MKWSSLLPSNLNPILAFRQLFDVDHNIATHALRDIFIFLMLGISFLFALMVLWQTIISWVKTNNYLKITKGGAQASGAVLDSKLPLFLELKHHLIEFPSRDGESRMLKRRTVDGSEIFKESILGPGFCSSRLFLAIPSILTGLGVLGTFVGLQLGIGGLDSKSYLSLTKACPEVSICPPPLL